VILKLKGLLQRASGVLISRIVRQNAGSMNPGRKFITGFRNRPTPKRFTVLGECPAPNQLRNLGRVGATDYRSDNLEIKTPEALNEWIAQKSRNLGTTSIFSPG
jgi:hypothetical protein